MNYFFTFTFIAYLLTKPALVLGLMESANGLLPSPCRSLSFFRLDETNLRSFGPDEYPSCSYANEAWLKMVGLTYHMLVWLDGGIHAFLGVLESVEVFVPRDTF